jgi:uncharacterized RDD family membrane protein YckC
MGDGKRSGASDPLGATQPYLPTGDSDTVPLDTDPPPSDDDDSKDTEAIAVRPAAGAPRPSTTLARGAIPSQPALRTATTAILDDKRGDGDPLIGQKLRHYQVVKLLGRGGMGAVYLGHDTSLDRPVALKVLAPEIATDGAMVTRFVREARAQARLRHPNVVQIYFIGEDRGVHFFAMEYVAGAALDTTLDAGKAIPWETALRYAEQAARGLRAALAEGFIHRDVKPSNLLVDAEGHVKLADFGLVKRMDGDSDLTHHGQIIGSPLYMAPEQGRGDTVDHRSDIYSLGCTLYHMLAGQPPFKHESPVAVMSMHVTDFATRIRAHKPDVPETIERLVDRMMSKAPGQRFETYDELLAAMEAARPKPARREDRVFWKRALALAIDGALTAALSLLTLWLVPVAVILGVVGVGLFGQTPGKWIVGLQVVDQDGRRLSWKRAVARAAVAGWGPAAWAVLLLVVYLVHRHDQVSFRVSSLTFDRVIEPLVLIGVAMGILLTFVAGYLLAAFHPRRLALHDLVAKSQVVDAPKLRGLRRRPNKR